MTKPGDDHETGIEESNPNAAGPQGLRGDMGVSSERVGAGEDDEVEGTGIRGTAASGTDGALDTSSAEPSGEPLDQPNPAEVPEHEFDPERNPGHSHG